MPPRRRSRVELIHPIGAGIDWDEALRLHEEAGLSYAAIAKRFGYSSKTIHAALSARGARPHPLRLRGARDRRLHRLWMSMRARSHRPSHPSYPQFGGRGIRVCVAWRRSFDAFREWARRSGWRPGLRIGRRRASRDFTPANCMWLTAREEITSHRLGRRPGGKGKRKARIDWDEAVRLYRDEGVSRRELARRFGAHPSSIDVGLRRRRVKRTRAPAPTSTPEGYRIHKTWVRLHRICNDPQHPAYRYYGGRGVRISREWKRFEPFLRWALATGSRPKLCLTRIDRSRGYTPSNCEWVTRAVVIQRKRHPGPREGRLLITAWGETKSLASWSRDPRCKVTRSAVRQRLRSGSSPERAIGLEPLGPGSKDWRRTEIRAFGTTKGLADWGRDRRCRIGATGLASRLARGWDPEDAIATPPYEEPPSGGRRR